jgi:cytochrome c6
MKRFARSALAFALLTAAGAARAEGAAALFQKKCATCHGMDGRGQTKMGERMGIKDLAASTATAADLEKLIADGRGKMPAFKGRISDDEIKSVAAFVKAGLK